MKKTLTMILAGAIALVSTNCTTTYDAYGNPRQSVDPGTAVAGAAAVGVLGYALAKDKNKTQNNYYGRDRYDRHDRHNHGGYYDRYGNYRRY
jgi:hypothetical protein